MRAGFSSASQVGGSLIGSGCLYKVKLLGMVGGVGQEGETGTGGAGSKS